jgi:subtilisin family serine protease
MDSMSRRPLLLFLLLCIPALIVVVGAVEAVGAAAATPNEALIESRADVVAGGSDKPFVDGEVLVRFKPETVREDGVGDGPVSRIHSRVGAAVEQDFSPLGLEGVQLVRLPPGGSVDAALASYRSDPNVLYAEPNYIVRTGALPNDPDFSLQWGLRNTGQTIEGSRGTAGADIDAVSAWAHSTGSRNVVIAMIDTGVDYTHPDLVGNIWKNQRETPGNRVDDDRNGYIDDIRGWDFRNRDADPFDDNGHGTHCAGILGASGNNGIGGSGVMQRVSLLPLKFLNAEGWGNKADEVKAILYARAAGATIICCSIGSTSYSATERSAIEETNALFVCAAGNTGSNNDVTPVYPASYSSGNIIAVAATDNRDRLADFSSFGKNTVDLGAPGLDIYSTLSDGQYGCMSGTSMATAMVAGAAGLVKSRYPSLPPASVRLRILQNIDTLASLKGRVASGGRLNAFRALMAGSSSVTLDARFTASPIKGPAPLSVRFTDVSTGAPIAWDWTFGDGATSSVHNPVHIYRNPGLYTVALTVRDASGTSKTLSRPAMIMVGGTPAEPWYRPHVLPARIEAEDYDVAGPDVSFKDMSSANEGGAYRPDESVDIEYIPLENSYSVGWIRAGEYLVYSVEIAQAGTYIASFRAANPDAMTKVIHVDLDNIGIGTAQIGATGSFENFKTFTVPLTLPSGDHSIKLRFPNKRLNLNYIDFTLSHGAVTTPIPGEATFVAESPTNPVGTAVRFKVTPRAGKTIRAAWWSFDSPDHLYTWNSRVINPTFFYPVRGTFSPYVQLTYTDGTTDVVHRVKYIRAI